MEDFYYAGGLRALLATLSESAHARRARRSTARTLGEAIARRRGAQPRGDPAARPAAQLRGRPRGSARQPRPGRRGDQGVRGRPGPAAPPRAGASSSRTTPTSRRGSTIPTSGHAGLGARAQAGRAGRRTGHARVGHAADPQAAARGGRPRHGPHLRRAHERHELRHLRAPRRARVGGRRPAGAGARRRPDRARRRRRGVSTCASTDDELARRREQVASAGRPRSAATASCSCAMSPRPTWAATSTSCAARTAWPNR